MLSLAKNLYGKYFEEYISICFDVADIFSLTENGWTEAKKSGESVRILRLLEPYHIRTIRAQHWFCQSVPVGYEKEVYIFSLTEDSKKILLQEYNSIFYDDTIWLKPEDICFFKNGKLISGSISHERICYVYDYESIFSESISLQNAWEVVPHNPNEQINLPK